ncbi:MAG TPA: CIA30 family protein [Opitutaceae bacterium]|nr:CIA30 family protein [Opitutaceae bacterium]
MKTQFTLPRLLAPTSATVFAAIFLAAANLATAENASALVDDYTDAHKTSGGAERLVITDKDIGGHSQSAQSCESGIVKMEGELVPARGQPAFISMISMLTPKGEPRDASRYEGVRLKVKVKKGLLSVQVSSADITNYDYHASAPIRRKPEEFQEVKIPFKDLKRAWSEQTPLNVKAITSINLVAIAMGKDTFAYEVDEVGFY